MIEPMVTEGDAMDETVTLIEELIAALELREASDPDSPPWVAEREDPVPRAPDHGVSP